MKTARLVWMAVIALTLASCSRDPQVLKRKYLENGNKYFNTGKYKEASLLYRKAIQADALFGEAYYRLALADLKLGRIVDAARSLRRSVELQPDNDDAANRLADIYLGAYMADTVRNKALGPELRDLSSRLLQRDAKSFTALRINGYLSLRDGKVKEAIETFQQANAIKPLQPDVTLALAQALMADKRAEEGEKLVRQLLEKDKTYGSAYDVLYLHYTRTNRIAEGEKLLISKLEANPKVPRYRLQLAGHYFATRDKEAMERTLAGLTGNRKDFPNARMLAGDFLFRVRLIDRAIQEYEQGVKENEANLKEKHMYQKRVIEALSTRGRSAEALQLAENVLKEDPKDDEAIAMRASLRLLAGRSDEVQRSIDELQSVVRKMPDNPVLRFNLGRALFSKGDFEASIVQFRESLKLRPDYIPAKLMLSQLHLRKGEFAPAEQMANEILQQAPNLLEARLLQARAGMGLGKGVQVRETLTSVLKLAPENRDAIFLLGKLNFDEKRYGEAESLFRKLSDFNPPDIRGIMGLVEADIAQERFEAAIGKLRKELDKNPSNTDLRLMIGNTAVRGRMFDLAIAEYNKILEQRPNDGNMYLRIGEALRRKGDNEGAIASFRKAKDLLPNQPVAYVRLSLLLESMGRRDQARPLYEQILKLEPDNPIALNNLAYIMAEEGRDLDLALTYAEKAKQKLPNDVDISDTLGWIYIKKNLADDAVRIFRDLVAKQPANPTFRYHLAMALVQRGDKPQAKRELEAALRNKPSKDEEAKIKELLTRIG